MPFRTSQDSFELSCKIYIEPCTSDRRYAIPFVALGACKFVMVLLHVQLARWLSLAGGVYLQTGCWYDYRALRQQLDMLCTVTNSSLTLRCHFCPKRCQCPKYTGTLLIHIYAAKQGRCIALAVFQYLLASQESHRSWTKHQHRTNTVHSWHTSQFRQNLSLVMQANSLKKKCRTWQ